MPRIPQDTSGHAPRAASPQSCAQLLVFGAHAPISTRLSRVVVGTGKPQATIASLAEDKAAAQTHAAELEAKLARVAGDHRRRAEKSRQAKAVAADRLSVAESRARAAEARVETVVRYLTLSERRLREAEGRVAASVRRKAKEREGPVEAASAERSRTNDAKSQELARGVVGGVTSEGQRGAGFSVAQRHAGETQLSPSPSGGVHDHSQGWTSRGEVDGGRGTNHASGFVDERQQHSDAAGLQENRDPAGRPTVASGFAASDNEDTANILREVKAARRQVAVAEQQAVALRVNANRVKAEAAKTAAEADIGKERAMMESERLVRQLKATGIEVWRTGGGSRAEGFAHQRHTIDDIA